MLLDSVDVEQPRERDLHDLLGDDVILDAEEVSIFIQHEVPLVIESLGEELDFLCHLVHETFDLVLFVLS